MGKIAFIILQLSWGLPQSIVGFLVFLVCLRRPHFAYHGAIATLWRFPYSSSLGMFVFVSDEQGRYEGIRSHEELDERTHRILVHEYGHCIQSLIMGPLYLPLFAIPSAIWCMVPVLARRRARRGTSYYAFYTERLANALGELATHERSMR